MKIQISATILSIVLITGVFMISVGLDSASATKDNNPGKAKGCEKGAAKNNPHCSNTSCDVSADPTGDCDGDGITNSSDNDTCDPIVQ